MQLCGRAGRSGRPARAHLFYMPKQKFKQQMLQQYCTEQENCRRLALLRGIGSSEELCRNAMCCDVCVSVVPYSHLDILIPGKVQRRKRRTVVREIGKDLSERLKARLQEERERIMDENPSFQMVGSNFICPDAAISELCTQAKHITSVDDLDLFCLRPQLRDRFLKVIMDTVCDAPRPKRRPRLR